MDRKIKSIELRSEKVRNIIGRIPSGLIRNGVLMLCSSLVVLFVISAFLPFRETMPILVRIEVSPKATFIHAGEEGYFVSDSMMAVNSRSLIGYIINRDSVRKIKSPAQGTVLVNVGNKAYLRKGELLCIIIPEEHICYGISEIPMEDYYKIKEGNRIAVKMNEKEKFFGIIEKKNSFPLNNKYTVKVRFEEERLLDRSLVNSVFNGEIILYEVSILEKIVSSMGVKL